MRWLLASSSITPVLPRWEAATGQLAAGCRPVIHGEALSFCARPAGTGNMQSCTQPWQVQAAGTAIFHLEGASCCTTCIVGGNTHTRPMPQCSRAVVPTWGSAHLMEGEELRRVQPLHLACLTCGTLRSQHPAGVA